MGNCLSVVLEQSVDRIVNRSCLLEWMQPIVPVTEHDELLDAEDQLPWSYLQNAESYYQRIKWKVPDKSDRANTRHHHERKVCI